MTIPTLSKKASLTRDMSLRTMRKPPKRKAEMTISLMRLMKKMKIALMKKKRGWRTNSLALISKRTTMIVSRMTMTRLCRENKSTMKMMMTMMNLMNIIIMISNTKTILSVPVGQTS